MEAEFTMIAWIAYWVASLILMGISWYLTRNWRPLVLARILRVWLMVILLTPAYVDLGSTVLAPAWVVTLFVAASDGIADASHGYLPLLAALLVGTSVIIVGASVQWRQARQRVDASRA